MNMLKRIATIILLSTAITAAQDKPPQPSGTVYRLEYTVIEMEGAKKTSSRSYTALVEDRRRGSLRVGTRVPVPTGEKSFNYVDVGVNIDATPTGLDAQNIRLDTTVDITSVVVGGSSNNSAPVVRLCRNSVIAVIPLDKPVMIATQDDPTNTTSVQVQVLAKQVK